MTALSREVVLGRLKQLPALPSAVSTLLLSFADDDVDVDRVAGQIAKDQGLAARVLRVANSSFYGLPAKVGSIHEAVVMLGFRAVRSLVLAVGINGVFRVNKRRRAAEFLGLGDNMLCQGRLAGRFRSEDFDNTPPWNAADSQGAVQGN